MKKYFEKKDGAKVTEENFPKIKGNSYLWFTRGTATFRYMLSRRWNC